MGVVAPNAVGIPDFLAALKSGRSGVRKVAELGENKFSCRIAGIPEVPVELIHRYFNEEDRRGMNSNMVFGGLAALECWMDAGFAWSPETRYTDKVDWETDAIIGSIIGGMDTCVQTVHQVDAGRVRFLGSMVTEQMMGNSVSAKVSDLLALGGHVSSNSGACVTGAEAIVEGYYRIREGRAMRVMVGGSEGVSLYSVAGLDSMRLLTTGFNEAPERGSRPLSATSTGFVPAAGAGVLMLESLDSALARGARIHGEVLGGAVNCGGFRNGGSMTMPNCQAVVRCIRKALGIAGLEASEVDLINGHLTGTGADFLEIQNWKESLKMDWDRFPLVQATKSLTGHTFSAGGAIEVIASLLQLKNGFLHPTRNCEDLDPRLPELAPKIQSEAVSFAGKVVGKTSFGFGNLNACLFLRKWG
jgi:3-oxoacyl-(acyl-carrier-protein) synthase